MGGNKTIGPFGSRTSISPASPPVQPVSPESGIGPGSVGGFGDRPHVAPGQSTPLEASQTDQAKRSYTGLLGDFFVDPGRWAHFPPCPQPRRPLTQDIRTHELYSPVLGGVYIGHDDDRPYECADGSILMMGSIPAARRYFVGPAVVAWNAPLNRLELMRVAGYPAIAKLPDPAFPDMVELVVVQRFPSDNKPGILIYVGYLNTLDEAVAKAERIIGVRP